MPFFLMLQVRSSLTSLVDSQVLVRLACLLALVFLAPRILYNVRRRLLNIPTDGDCDLNVLPLAMKTSYTFRGHPRSPAHTVDHRWSDYQPMLDPELRTS